MQEYEIAVLYHPDLELDLDKPMKKVEKILTDSEAKIKKTDNWGKKKMAYKIVGQDHAVYVFYTVDVPKTNIAKVEATLNITDEVIRFLISKTDERIAIAEKQKLEREAKMAERAAREPKEEVKEEAKEVEKSEEE